jgi:hypothetical protein
MPLFVAAYALTPGGIRARIFMYNELRIAVAFTEYFRFRMIAISG